MNDELDINHVRQQQQQPQIHKSPVPIISISSDTDSSDSSSDDGDLHNTDIHSTCFCAVKYQYLIYYMILTNASDKEIKKVLDKLQDLYDGLGWSAELPFGKITRDSLPTKDEITEYDKRDSIIDYHAALLARIRPDEYASEGYSKSLFDALNY